MIWLLPALLAACSDHAIVSEQPDPSPGDPPRLELTPERLDFGAGPRGAAVERSLRLSNTGGGVLQLQDLAVTESGLFYLTEPPPSSLGAGESATIALQYTPWEPLDQGLLVVRSDDPVTPMATVELVGSAQLPELSYAPALFEFGALAPGCALEQSLELRNVGEGDLMLEGLVLPGDGFRLMTPPELPLTLSPGEPIRLGVGFLPIQEQDYTDLLQLHHSGDSSPDLVPLAGRGATWWEETFITPDYNRADLLLYVDRSGSMADNQAGLTANITRFSDAMQDQDADWRIAVIIDDSGCHSGQLLSPDTPNLELALRQLLQGSGGALNEAGLSLVRAALEHTDSGACNAAIGAEGGAVAAVMLSDEPDQSPQAWDEVVADIQTLRPDIRLSAVAGDFPNGCANAEPGLGYYQATQLTGGAFFSICDERWGEALERIAFITGDQLGRSVNLLGAPEPSTLQVSVDNALVDGWRWDAPNNAVVFEAEHAPPPLSEVRVGYYDGPGCEQ